MKIGAKNASACEKHKGSTRNRLCSITPQPSSSGEYFFSFAELMCKIPGGFFRSRRMWRLKKLIGERARWIPLFLWDISAACERHRWRQTELEAVFSRIGFELDEAHKVVCALTACGYLDRVRNFLAVVDFEITHN